MNRFAIFANSYQGQLKRGVENSHKYINSILQTYGISQREDSVITTQDFDTDSGLFKLYDKVSEYQEKNELPIIFGGDHHIAAATVASSLKNYRDNFKLLWIDAHTDINTMEESESKNKHGMPIASLMGLMDPWIPDVPLLKPEQIIYVGIRSVDDFEMEMLKKYNIETYFAEDILKSNKTNNLHHLLKHIYRKPIENIHISFDVDVLDPIYMPCTGTPVEDGLDLETIRLILNDVSKNSNIIANDIVELNLELAKDIDDICISQRTFEKYLDILYEATK